MHAVKWASGRCLLRMTRRRGGSEGRSNRWNLINISSNLSNNCSSTKTLLPLTRLFLLRPCRAFCCSSQVTEHLPANLSTFARSSHRSICFPILSFCCYLSPLISKCKTPPLDAFVPLNRTFALSCTLCSSLNSRETDHLPSVVTRYNLFLSFMFLKP